MESKVAIAAKPVKIPGPDHPITIERNPARIIVSIAGRIVADTREALTLRIEPRDTLLHALTPRPGLVLDGISSDGSTPKGLQSIRFLTKAEPCDEPLFDPIRK